MKKKILIYDDERGRTRQFKNKLDQALKQAGQETAFNVKPLLDEVLQYSIKVLQNRQVGLRESGTCSDEATEFDDTSIFIIDYDLLNSQENLSENQEIRFLTGEVIAYIVRCFSDCKLIIGLNQYGNNPFDLTLRGHPESFADLNLGVDQLGNPDLWRGDWGDSRRGYRPWYWPNLSDSLHHFDEKVADVRENLKQENLNEPIHEVIGFDRELFQLLPREIVQFIGKETEPVETTFREFVRHSGNGLRSKDKDILDDQVLARVGAARISKWLERFVLPEQDILVDAPHLVSRYPSLIDNVEKKIKAWNSTTQLVDYRELGLDIDLIECCRFKKDYWISRPVWFWAKLRECEHIKEVSEPWLTVKPNWSFCEDASRFYNQNACREFLADTVSPFTRRCIKGFKNVDYRPRVRLAL